MDRINKIPQESLLLIALMLTAGGAGAANVKNQLTQQVRLLAIQVIQRPSFL